MRSARCVFKGFHRERSHQLSCFWASQGKVICTQLSFWHSAGARIGKAYKQNWQLQEEKFFLFLVMNSPPLPLHHISVTVPRCLVNFVWTLTVFSSSKISECSPWSCQISPNCLLLGVSLFFLGLFYAKPCTGDGSECLPQWKPSLGFLFITKHHKKSLMEVDEFCSVW